MLLRETGFTFDGYHCMNDFGMMYSEGSGHPAIPNIRRNEYEIAGMSGTVLFNGEVRQPLVFSGTLYPHRERKRQAENQVLLRQVQTWLTAGRKKLVFDYEPDKYYMAQLTKASQWSLKNWFGGELGISFQAEPFAYAVDETVWIREFTGTEATLTFNMQTGVPAPTVIEIRNISGGASTWDDKFYLGASLNDGQIALSGFSNWRHQFGLELSSEPPIDAVMHPYYTTWASWTALQRVTAFSPIRFSNGENTLKVEIEPEEGLTPVTRVTVRARGRW